LTASEAEELYVLQREFGISAQEALFVRPAWELDNLLRLYVRDRDRDSEEG
jgi:hypothetical protein